MKELNELVKSINYNKSKNSKGQISYKIKLELINGSSTELFVNKDDIELISVLRQLHNDQESIKSKKLVEMEREDGKTYYSINVELIDGTVLMYYTFSFNFIKILDLVRKSIENKENDTVVSKENKSNK